MSVELVFQSVLSRKDAMEACEAPVLCGMLLSWTPSCVVRTVAKVSKLECRQQRKFNDDANANLNLFASYSIVGAAALVSQLSFGAKRYRRQCNKKQQKQKSTRTRKGMQCESRRAAASLKYQPLPRHQRK
jgi:hypothetical protein